MFNSGRLLTGLTGQFLAPFYGGEFFSGFSFAKIEKYKKYDGYQ